MRRAESSRGRTDYGAPLDYTVSHHLLPCCVGPLLPAKHCCFMDPLQLVEAWFAGICSWKLPAPPRVASSSLLLPACCRDKLPSPLLRLLRSHCDPFCS